MRLAWGDQRQRCTTVYRHSGYALHRHVTATDDAGLRLGGGGGAGTAVGAGDVQKADPPAIGSETQRVCIAIEPRQRDGCGLAAHRNQHHVVGLVPGIGTVGEKGQAG
jgi:hypothetical protein